MTLLFFVMLIFIVTTPLAFAHPITLSAELNSSHEPPHPYVVIGLDNSVKNDPVDIEFLSIGFFWQNFITLLVISIGSIMGVVVAITFKEEIFEKNMS